MEGLIYWLFDLDRRKFQIIIDFDVVVLGQRRRGVDVQVAKTSSSGYLFNG